MGVFSMDSKKEYRMLQPVLLSHKNISNDD